MTEQEMAEYFAKAAKPRLMELLKLKVRHIYETTPGNANSRLIVGGSEITFKLLRSTQPYREIERFTAADKVLGFVVNPGLLPLVKSIMMDVRGRNVLVTRRIESRAGDKGVVAHLEDFGIRLRLSFHPDLNETEVTWECLYGVA